VQAILKLKSVFRQVRLKMAKSLYEYYFSEFSAVGLESPYHHSKKLKLLDAWSIASEAVWMLRGVASLHSADFDRLWLYHGSTHSAAAF